MAEVLTILGTPVYDRYGDVVEAGEEREVAGCVVGLQGQSGIEGGGVWDGDSSTLEVFAPPGTVISEGDIVSFRGLRWQVKHAPFDWSVGRRPVNSRHRPRVRFLIERGEA